MWEGAHVRLRGVSPDDWEHFMRWATDTEAMRHGWMVHPPQGEEAARKSAREQSAAAPDGDNYRFIIETLEGVPVGALNTHGCELLHRTFRYGINLERQYWGRGYAEDAIRILLRFMFDERGYNKVNAMVYAFNERSRRAHEKFGMVLEGRLREMHLSEGVYHDVFAFGMTAAEFRDRYPNLA